MLLKYKAQVTPKVYSLVKPKKDQLPKVYTLFKEPCKTRKHSIIDKKSTLNHLGSQTIIKLHPVIKIIAEQLYIEDQTKIKPIIEALNKLYEENLSLRPLLRLAAAAASGARNNGTPQQPSDKFKFIGVDSNSLGGSIVFMQHPSIFGLYSSKNSVFFVTNEQPLSGPIIPTLIHEICHMIAGTIFQHTPKSNNPYEEGSKESKIFGSIVIAAMQIVNQDFANPNEAEKFITKRIGNLKRCYHPTKYPAELIVLVPQVFAMFGDKEGRAALEKLLPDLLKYYETTFWDTCNTYLMKSGFDKYFPNETKEDQQPPAIPLGSSNQNLFRSATFSAFRTRKEPDITPPVLEGPNILVANHF